MVRLVGNNFHPFRISGCCRPSYGIRPRNYCVAETWDATSTLANWRGTGHHWGIRRSRPRNFYGEVCEARRNRIQKQIADANERGSEALGAAAQAEKETAELQIDVAEARKRQADAERALVELKLNRSPRSLLFDRLTFMGVLDTSPKGTVEVLYPRGDAEAFEFAELVLTCFAVTRWTLTSHAIPIPDEDPSGVPGILAAGGRPSGIIVRGGGAIEGPFRSAVAAFRSIESRSQQYQVSAFSSGDLPEGLVRIIIGPKR